MKKLLSFMGVVSIFLVLIIWLAPAKVVLYNNLTDEKLTITNKGQIESLVAPLETIEKAEDRVKTPFSNRLIIYKGFVPVKRINFAMPSMFEEDKMGQIIVWGKPYKIDGTFYRVLAKIAREKNFTLDTIG